MGKVGTPATTWVEDKLLFQGGAVCRPPEDSEPGLQAGRGSFVAESESGHPRGGESTPQVPSGKNTGRRNECHDGLLFPPERGQCDMPGTMRKGNFGADSR